MAESQGKVRKETKAEYQKYLKWSQHYGRDRLQVIRRRRELPVVEVPIQETPSQFSYSAKEWLPIARLIGRWSMTFKERLESAARAFLDSLPRDEELQLRNGLIQHFAALAAATRNYRAMLDGTDYVFDGRSLLDDLDYLARRFEATSE